MTPYRFYVIRPESGRAPPTDVECLADAGAFEFARDMSVYGTGRVEIWKGERFVGEVVPTLDAR